VKPCNEMTQKEKHDWHKEWDSCYDLITHEYCSRIQAYQGFRDMVIAYMKMTPAQQAEERRKANGK
jgi:hypothetical protein